ncbi:MAG: hypothetical protein HW416_3316 [Chloroflexi bacterium]|nr:hypothetical protein [Chloroflexota bacterium]
MGSPLTRKDADLVSLRVADTDLVVGSVEPERPWEPREALLFVRDEALRRHEGAQVQFQFRGSSTDTLELAAVADYWRQAGLDVAESITSPALARDPEYQATFPGIELTGRASGEEIFPDFDGRLLSTPENRFTGANRSHYTNGSLDRLIDSMYGALDDTERGRRLREAGEILGADLPALPSHFTIGFAAVVKGVHAFVDDYPTIGPAASGAGLVSRNAQRWDRD